MDTATISQQATPIPFYTDGKTTLYQGDSSQLISQLGLQKLDVVHVVTDPPYGIGLEYGDTSDSWRPDHLYWTKLYNNTPGLTSLHMTVSNKHLDEWMREVTAAGWIYMHTSVYWNQGRAGGNWGGQYAYAWEPLLSFKKDVYSFVLGKRMLSDVFPHSGARTTLHPAERDISAWHKFMSHLPEGVIFDPFVGSGTTLKVAQIMDRDSIGIEREERWCRMAADRISQLSLFT